MCNLYLAMMDRMGVHMEHFGDATGQVNLAEIGWWACFKFARAGKAAAGDRFRFRLGNGDRRCTGAGDAIRLGR